MTPLRAEVVKGLNILIQGMQSFNSEEFARGLYDSVAFLVGKAGLDAIQRIPPDDRDAEDRKTVADIQKIMDEIFPGHDDR
jgi:hypothetical protein